VFDVYLLKKSNSENPLVILFWCRWFKQKKKTKQNNN